MGSHSIQLSLVPGLNMDDVITGTTVTIHMYRGRKAPYHNPFTVPRALLCAKSEYFGRMFDANGSFKEAITKECTVTDVRPWVFRVFVGWLYTGSVAFYPRVYEDVEEVDGLQSLASEGRHDYWTWHECQPDKPTTWTWELLFDVYLFADQYSTRKLCQAVFEIFQTKVLMENYGPGDPSASPYPLPDPNVVARVVKRLPDASPLVKFLVQVYAHAESVHSYYDMLSPPIVDCADVLPSDFILAMFEALRLKATTLECLACQGDWCANPDHKHEHGLNPREQEWCLYHEHETEEEQQVCSLKREQAKAVFEVRKGEAEAEAAKMDKE